VTDPDPFVRAEALGGLGASPPLLDALISALDDDFPVVRRQAVRSLREAGGPRAARALIEAANQDPSAEVREEAVAALAAMLRAAQPQRHASRY
jgi:HEAT repeat protein